VSIYGKGLRGKATKLHAELVRGRGSCANCGGTSNLQCAHIIPRRYAATRTDPANAYCLDARCHMRFTEHADEWMAFIDRTIGRAEFDRLKAKAEAGVKANDAFWQAEVSRLTAMLESVA
jgi:5-methylcytosine-specific restriction endonuclease McrA